MSFTRPRNPKDPWQNPRSRQRSLAVGLTCRLGKEQNFHQQGSNSWRGPRPERAVTLEPRPLTSTAGTSHAGVPPGIARNPPHLSQLHLTPRCCPSHHPRAPRQRGTRRGRYVRKMWGAQIRVGKPQPEPSRRLPAEVARRRCRRCHCRRCSKSADSQLPWLSQQLSQKSGGGKRSSFPYLPGGGWNQRSWPRYQGDRKEARVSPLGKSARPPFLLWEVRSRLSSRLQCPPWDDQDGGKNEMASLGVPGMLQVYSSALRLCPDTRKC